ncbi:MAG: 2Fe-2S iron-sulfur cluster binding domain-containing protein [Candidatus Aminicenantes bacterium]|nr:2Fe-2S iron-sulfur cluster binding domain-containing protein [Candidatus Aminicenantes bacterium]
MKHRLNLRVNKQDFEVFVKPKTTLVDLLRDELGLTGTNKGCGTGECGACTVLMNGNAVNSCLVLAVEADGAEITTIEGLASEGRLDPLQQAFVDEGAIQCGFCTPGMILVAKDFLEKNPQLREEDYKTAISGNLCRCTGYVKIVKAIKKVAEGE